MFGNWSEQLLYFRKRKCFPIILWQDLSSFTVWGLVWFFFHNAGLDCRKASSSIRTLLLKSQTVVIAVSHQCLPKINRWSHLWFLGNHKQSFRSFDLERSMVASYLSSSLLLLYGKDCFPFLFFNCFHIERYWTFAFSTRNPVSLLWIFSPGCKHWKKSLL